MKQLIVTGVGQVGLMILGLLIGCVLSISMRVIAALRSGNSGSAVNAGAVRAAGSGARVGGRR